MQNYPPDDLQATVPHQPQPQPPAQPQPQQAYTPPAWQQYPPPGYVQNPPQPYGQSAIARTQVHPGKQPARSSQNRRFFMFAIPGILLVLVAGIIGAIILAVGVIYGSGNILPGVSAGGVDIGGMSQAEASARLTESWNNEGIVLRDGENAWQIMPGELGLMIDGDGTAAAAHDWGRNTGGILGGIDAIINGKDIEPQLIVNLNQARTRLEEIRSIVEQPPVNAGVRLVNGQVQAVPPVQGRSLDINTTLERLQQDAAGELADGALDLAMFSVAPAVTDATPLVEQARLLLSSQMTLDIYDPVRDELQVYNLQPTDWGQWLVATPDVNSPIGLSLSLDENGVRQYLQSISDNLGSGRYLDIDESVGRINAVVANQQLNTWLQVYHTPSVYIAQGGDTISGIGYELGFPYPWIQAINPGVDALNPGQQIQIPSPDDLLPLPVIRNKRIIISIPQQRMWVYENGNLVLEEPISTGISRSPTSPGIFQIQSHEINAYAQQWNLYMPHFMGVYHPGPNVDVMNGFHGFPTNASSQQLLWENNLGSPATYGCILVGRSASEWLYNWAEEGVVVEIQG